MSFKRRNRSLLKLGGVSVEKDICLGFVKAMCFGEYFGSWALCAPLLWQAGEPVMCHFKTPVINSICFHLD